MFVTARTALIAHTVMETPSAEKTGSAGGLIEQNRDYFGYHVGTLAAAASKGIESEAALGREALEIAQQAGASAAAGTVHQMALRFASGNGALAALAREAQDLAQLKLNVDWVVLSACNTTAGDKPGAKALSRLARAFFYAGARASTPTRRHASPLRPSRS
jgi:hypothetical protein